MIRFFLVLLTMLCYFDLSNHAIAVESTKANENLYFVENIPTKTKAKSPAIARSQAIASARRDGFLILLTRLQLDLATADQVSDEEISDMVSSEQIQDEKYAGNNYSAIFNITYAKNFVDHILKQKKTISTKSINPFANNANSVLVDNSPSIIIAGIYENNRITLWENENLWRYALSRYLSLKSKKNYIVIQPKIDDISRINVNNVENLKFSDLEATLAKYQANSAYVVLLNYDNIENKIILEVNYLRKMQNKNFRLSFVNVDRLNYEKLLDTVAQKAVDYLSQNQLANDKELNQNYVKLGIYLKDLDSWIEVRKKLENANFISQINIDSFARDYALISVNYLADINKIKDNFNSINLELEKKEDNFYNVVINQ